MIVLSKYFDCRQERSIRKIKDQPIKKMLEIYNSHLKDFIEPDKFKAYMDEVIKERTEAKNKRDEEKMKKEQIENEKKKIELEKKLAKEEYEKLHPKDKYGFEGDILSVTNRDEIKKTLLWIVYKSDFKSADKVKALIEYNKMNTEDSNNPFASDLSIQSKIDMLKKLLTVDDILSVINLLSPKDIEYIKTNLK